MTHIFLPRAPLSQQFRGIIMQAIIELVQEIGRCISAITEDNKERVFLFPRLSVALQKGNAIIVSFLGTFLQDWQNITATYTFC